MNPLLPQGLNQIHKISRVMIYFMVTFLPPEGDRTLHPSCLPLALPLIFSATLSYGLLRAVKTLHRESCWGAEVGVTCMTTARTRRR